MIHDSTQSEGNKYKEDTFTGGKGIGKHEKPGDKAIGPLVKYKTQTTRKKQSV